MKYIEINTANGKALVNAENIVAIVPRRDLHNLITAYELLMINELRLSVKPEDFAELKRILLGERNKEALR